MSSKIKNKLSISGKNKIRSANTYEKWAILTSMKIWEAAVLMAGFDPHELADITVPSTDPADTYGDPLDYSWHERALISAVNCHVIQATVPLVESATGQTEILKESLVSWLETRGKYDVAEGLMLPLPGTQEQENIHAKGQEWSTADLESLEDLRRGHTARQTADRFGISEARIRKLLAKHKLNPRATPFSGLGK